MIEAIVSMFLDLHATSASVLFVGGYSSCLQLLPFSLSEKPNALELVLLLETRQLVEDSPLSTPESHLRNVAALAP